jgi:predicted transcriptional regulator
MDTQNAILTAINHLPGIHFRGLQRVTHLAVGQLQHHLHSLVKKGKVAAFNSFRYKCYCAPDIPENDRILLSLCWHPVCKEIIAHLLEHEGEHCGELRAHVKLSASTLSWYLSRLKKENIIVMRRHGKKQCIHLCDTEHVRTLLERYKETLSQKCMHVFH